MTIGIPSEHNRIVDDVLHKLAFSNKARELLYDRVYSARTWVLGANTLKKLIADTGLYIHTYPTTLRNSFLGIPIIIDNDDPDRFDIALVL